MTYRALLPLLLVPLLLGCQETAEAPGAAGEGETVLLFNGENLEGWTHYFRGEQLPVDSAFTVDAQEEIIICDGEPWGYLRTEEAYGNYRLNLEWRWDPAAGEDGNSGVFLLMQEPDEIWPPLIEAQLWSGRAGDFVLMGGMSLDTPEDRISPDNEIVRLRSESLENPVGEWNAYEITVQNGDVTLAVNGRQVNQGSNASETSGFIGLQSEGGVLHFRNIELTPLD